MSKTTFITFNKNTFKKGHPVKYNDRECVVNRVIDQKNGKYLISIKDVNYHHYTDKSRK